MGEVTQISFKHSELVELMIRKQGIHEGIWGLYVKFGLNATNVGPSEAELLPAGILVVVEIGIQKFEKESNIALDAAKVNPKKPETAGQ